MPGAYQSINAGLHFLSVMTGRYAAIAAGQAQPSEGQALARSGASRTTDFSGSLITFGLSPQRRWRCLQVDV